MESIIYDEIEKAKKRIQSNSQAQVSDDRAFSYILMEHLFFRGEEDHINDIHDMITDGANDGGIDFVFFDEDGPSVIIGQSKLTETLSYDDVVNELVKMSATIKDFETGNTGQYNKNVKREVQNALDALPDEQRSSVEYYVLTTATISESETRKKIETRLPEFPLDAFSLFQGEDIAEKIRSNMEEVSVVTEDKITIDHPNNYLEYDEPKTGRKGVMVNMSSESLMRLYNKYIDKGLLALNIRGFIQNKKVDSGIDSTLNKERENFWFYNNGITIACEDFDISGEIVRLYNFSIINGGQTTNRIGSYKGSNKERFFIPCKIIAHGQDEDSEGFFTTVAETSNSQKPIQPRDLKANSREMRKLQKWLKDKGIYLEVKRGAKKPKGLPVVKNDELAQAMLSFIYQQPGTARSGKRSIFEKDATYTKLFKKNYENDPYKKAFLTDLIELMQRYNNIDKVLKSNSGEIKLDKIEHKEALKNGKQTIFALMGILYRLANEDTSKDDLNEDVEAVIENDFAYGSFISNYRGDDIDEKLAQMIKLLSKYVWDAYLKSAHAENSTSISNFTKTDKKYRDEALPELAFNLQFESGDTLLGLAEDLFKRPIVSCD